MLLPEENSSDIYTSKAIIPFGVLAVKLLTITVKSIKLSKDVKDEELDIKF